MLVLAGVGVGGALAVLIVLGLVYGSPLKDRRSVPDAWMNSIVGDTNAERVGVIWLNEADDSTGELELMESTSESVSPRDRKDYMLY
ncbi:hypothetical protein DIPPA_35721 [Diplonema papillatum]|nr:hypothetical protein DIPPA_35721 [Diplonema papillatum]